MKERGDEEDEEKGDFRQRKKVEMSMGRRGGKKEGWVGCECS